MNESHYKNNMTIDFHVWQPLNEKLTDQANNVIVSFAEDIVLLTKHSQIEKYLRKHGKNSNHKS
jgi:hypothetical protein